MKIEFKNGSTIEVVNNKGENIRGKGWFYSGDDILSFSVKGNHTDEKYRFYSIEVLYKAWKDYIGNEINWIKDEKRIVIDVFKQDDEIIILTIPKNKQ